MPPVSRAIRSIRQRRGESMVQFAERLGLTQGSVSRYEAGKLQPSRSILLLLLQLAEGDEREPILEALGEVPSEMQLWEADLNRRVDEARKELSEFFAKMEGGQRARERFFDLAMEIVRSGRTPLPLIRAMELWRDHAGSSAAREVYEEAVMALATDLDRVERGLAPVGKKLAARQPDSQTVRKADRELPIMSLCPTHKKWFSTGATMTRSGFKIFDFGKDWQVNCPHCGMPHYFKKEFAKLGD